MVASRSQHVCEGPASKGTGSAGHTVTFTAACLTAAACARSPSLQNGRRTAGSGLGAAGQFKDVFQQDMYVGTFKTKTNLGKPELET